MTDEPPIGAMRSLLRSSKASAQSWPGCSDLLHRMSGKVVSGFARVPALADSGGDNRRPDVAQTSGGLIANCTSAPAVRREDQSRARETSFTSRIVERGRS